MKTIKYIFAVIKISILLQITLFCQDKEPEQVKFLYKGDSVFLNSQHPDFVQEKFILGWHWGGSKKISQALDMNQYDAEYYQDTTFMNDSVFSILKPEHIWTHYDNTRIMNTKGIVFEPTLLINKNDDPRILKTRVGDKTNPVFGFQKIKGYISNDSNDVNYSRLIIRDSLANKVILEEPSHSYTLFYQNRGYDAFDSNSVKYFGYGWYISINLKRISNVYGNPNDTILKIELPYKLGQDTANYIIRFDSIPYLSSDSSYFLPNSRGLVQKLSYAAEKPYVFCVFRSMLPYDTSITISAFFICDDKERNNHHLKHYINSADNTQIDSLKIKVTYLGGCDLAIENIVYETPNTQNMRRGYYDSQIITSYQNGLNQYNQPGYIYKGIKLFRFNPHVEGSIMNWCGERYVNKLVGNINSSENNCYFAKLFEHYVNPPNRWLGTWQVQNHISVPYSKQVYSSSEESKVKTMGLFNGYCGIDNGAIQTDPSKVHYETYLVDGGNGVAIDYFLENPNDWTKYEKVMNTQNNGWRASFQTYVEDHLYTHFLKETAKGFLFSDKFWWNQGFIHLTWKEVLNYVEDTNTFVQMTHRALTGEEFRLFSTLGVLLGAKGLFYDGAETDITKENDKQQFYDFKYLSDSVKTYLNSLSDEEFLDSDLAGPDFIRLSNEVMNLNDRLYDLDTIAKYLDRPATKLYIGRRSLRKEMKRLHDQIRRCEDELMKLRLVAWMGKGYRLWNNHHPDYPDDSTFRRFLAWDEANNIVDTSRFKSWPIGRYYKVTSYPEAEIYRPVYEPWDSTFIDFTLLKDKDTSINDLAYVGIQNRRTSPLLSERYVDSIYVGTDSARLATLYRISFYSTAEFEDSCDAAKNPNSYQKFRDHWFSRAGCRSVTVPFNYINPKNPNEYALLRITELGADEEFDSTWSYGRKMAYWHKIDTVIGQDRSITFNLLPGSGTILKVQVLHQDTTVSGSLLCSNQSKLVSYPVLRPDGTESDSIRYHLVYHKQVTFPGNFSGNAVFYRRSKIVSKDCMEENIVWESAVLVSDNINDIQNPYISCDYPSIVVRKDTDTLKAYIVYSCFKGSTSGMIVETILSVNDNIVLDKRGNKLADYNGGVRAEWGNPVVNASGNGNYYAWSDSLSGIYAGWKTPSATSFQANNKINFKYSDYPVTRAPQQHPSLNVYSHLDSLEDNCALVWQEYIPTDSKSRILYTRLKHNGNNLYKYLSPVFLNDPIVYGIKDNMAMLDSSNSLKYRYPVVNRGLGLYRVSPPSNSARRRYDLVYWETNNGLFEPLNNYLINVLVWNQDTSNVPIQWSISWCNYIKSYYKCIGLPNISQFLDAGLFMSPYYTSLNFIYYDSFLNSLVGHFKYDSYNTHSFVTTQTSPDPDYIDWTDANELWVKRVDSGTLPHLSKNKQPLGEMWNNRRVYQKNTSYWSNIITSAKYFYKGQSDELLADWYIGFETADSSKKSFLFGAPELDEQRFSLKLPFEKVVSDEGYISFVETSSDTIASSWFSIEDPKELALKLKGSNNANSKVYIQNKETERTLRLNLPNGLKENKGAKAKYNLINGLGNEFRLLFVKNDDAMQYTEELWIEGLPIEEKPAGSFKESDGIENVDLIQIVNRYYSESDISIFPNPASEVLYLQANVPFEEATLTVTNLLGTKVIKQQIDLSNSPELKLDISFLLPGIYYVNISDGLKSISGKFLKR